MNDTEEMRLILLGLKGLLADATPEEQEAVRNAQEVVRAEASKGKPAMLGCVIAGLELIVHINQEMGGKVNE